MLVAAYTVRIIIFDSHSLKSKRSVIKSIKERLRNKFNVSVAEVEYHDKHNYAEIGIAAISTKNRHLDEVFGKIMTFLESDLRFEVVEAQRVI